MQTELAGLPELDCFGPDDVPAPVRRARNVFAFEFPLGLLDAADQLFAAFDYRALLRGLGAAKQNGSRAGPAVIAVGRERHRVWVGHPACLGVPHPDGEQIQQVAGECGAENTYLLMSVVCALG